VFFWPWHTPPAASSDTPEYGGSAGTVELRENTLCKRAGGHFIHSVRDLRTKSAAVWKSLPKEREYVVTNNGRPIAILASVGEGDLEEALAAFRRARAMEAVAALQLDSVKNGTDRMSLKEITGEIRAARRERRR
jgi:antitoxin (DNA-binding transcriptional repressor) of toxin-antitoxin stability system